MDGDAALMELFRAIAAGEGASVRKAVKARPALAAQRLVVKGATRRDATDWFLTPILHYAYAGDTLLHIAAAAYDVKTADALLAAGADVRAANRRGAQPLHYACDGGPEAPHWDPAGQADVIARLVGAGAGVDALDRSGVAPLHRAVRCRCYPAVLTLLSAGADPLLPNGRGTRPLRLAEVDSGRGSAGSAACRAEQARIVELLRARIG